MVANTVFFILKNSFIKQIIYLVYQAFVDNCKVDKVFEGDMSDKVPAVDMLGMDRI